jgi:hypothetical protein
MPTPILYAKVSTDGQTILDRKMIGWSDTEPSPILDRATAESLGKPFWLPVVERGPQPNYDPETQYPPIETETIGLDSVVEGWSVPVSKTASEIETEKEQAATALSLSREGKAIKLLFVLGYGLLKEAKNQPNLTVNQYLNYLDSLPEVSDAAFITKLKTVI